MYVLSQRHGFCVCVAFVGVTIAMANPGKAEEHRSGDGDWCRTMAHYQRNHPEHMSLGTSTCPTEGLCDLPEIRDTYIPFDDSSCLTLRLKFNVFRMSDGTDPAATLSEVQGQLDRLNNAYAPAHIRFVAEIEFINDSQYRTVSEQEIVPMREAYADDPEHQINIFVMLVAWSYSQGTFPWDEDALTAQGGVLMDELMFGPDSSVLVHELGHNLGLWHTHHGVSEAPTGDPCQWRCYERAGSKSDTTGDFASDTDPTPVNWECTGPGGADPCTMGAPWGETDPQNYMSYAFDPCWTEFTPQQMGRMRCWITASLGSCLVDTQGDLDLDNDVDLDDFLLLTTCFTGPGATVIPVECDSCDFHEADMDNDEDVDLDDFAAFQSMIST